MLTQHFILSEILLIWSKKTLLAHTNITVGCPKQKDWPSTFSNAFPLTSCKSRDYSPTRKSRTDGSSTALDSSPSLTILFAHYDCMNFLCNAIRWDPSSPKMLNNTSSPSHNDHYQFVFLLFHYQISTWDILNSSSKSNRIGFWLKMNPWHE